MKKNNKNSLVKNVGIALIIMIIGTLAMCGLIGLLIGREIVPETMGTMIGAVLTEGLVLLICYWTARKSPKSRLPAAVITAGAYALIRLIIGTIAFPEMKLRFIHCIVTVMIGVVAGLMAGMKKERRR